MFPSSPPAALPTDGQAAAAFALGACGIQVGTCLLTSLECPIHENYKLALLKAKDSDTTVTGRSIGGPVRVLKNKMAREYLALEKRGATLEELEHVTLGGLRRAVFEGDMERGSVMAGSGGRYAPRDQAPASDLRGAVHRQSGRFEGHGGSMAVTIRGKALPLPILQGGMGVGISLDGLAGAVAACGGMGTLSTAVCGFQEPDFAKRPFEANLRALDRAGPPCQGTGPRRGAHRRQRHGRHHPVCRQRPHRSPGRG